MPTLTFALIAAMLVVGEGGSSCNSACMRAIGQGAIAGINTGIRLMNSASNLIDAMNGGSEADFLAHPTLICKDDCISPSDTDIAEAIESVSVSDGVCDDGGPGAQFSICFPGTDCTDCGAIIAELVDRCFSECPSHYNQLYLWGHKADFGRHCEDLCGVRVPPSLLEQLSSGSSMSKDEVRQAPYMPAMVGTFAGILLVAATIIRKPQVAQLM